MSEDLGSDSYDIKNYGKYPSKDPATNPAYIPSSSNKNDDPAKNQDNSLSDSYEDNKSDKKGSCSDEEDEEDKKRNEVRQEFTLGFEKKIAKYIPHKIKFEGDIRKKTIVAQIQLQEKYSSGIHLFKNYFLYYAEGALKILNKNLKLIFSQKIIQDDNEIFGLTVINDDTIVMAASDKVRIINLNEKQTDQFILEIMQEVKETDFCCEAELLHNGYLVLVGGDRKYSFYELEKNKEKITKDNNYKLVGSVEKVHNVYDDDYPDFIDFNNGRMLSWLNDDHNIKIIEYSPEQKIILSKNGYQLHNAGLICDKYAILMGLSYPQYDSWLMDTESLEIVKHWVTPQNDSFSISISENTFFYSSNRRIGYDEFIVNDGEFIRKNIYECYYSEDKKENWDERYNVRNVLDENTFIAKTWNNKVTIFKCSK